MMTPQEQLAAQDGKQIEATTELWNQLNLNLADIIKIDQQVAYLKAHMVREKLEAEVPESSFTIEHLLDQRAKLIKATRTMVFACTSKLKASVDQYKTIKESIPEEE